MKIFWVPFLLLISFNLADSRASIEKHKVNIPSNTKITLPNSETLDDEGKVVLGWEVDPVSETITFEIEALTTGYVGLGISPQGSMLGADIFIAGVGSNGNSYSSDRFGVGFAEPKIDDHSDWTLLEASEGAGKTYLKVSRALYTCDDEDYPITNDTNRIIWALGSTDTIEYHTSTRRGSRSLNLLAAPAPDVNLDEFSTWEMLTDMTMPAKDTTYWCSFHKAPLLSRKHQIVGFDAFLKNPEAMKYTHHFILYNCFLPPNSNLTLDEVFGDKTVDTGFDGNDCYGPSSANIPVEYCPEYLYVWAKGGKTMLFPENVGYPIATAETAGVQQYYMMEIHFDNPDRLENVAFETGVQVYYTDKLRPIDAGLITIGHKVDGTLTVPPNAKDYVAVGHCSPECTAQLRPEGLTVFNTLLHSHLSGQKLILRHFRNNIELPWIDYDNHYDFDYQQNKQLVEEIKILPGDQLSYECYYDSTWKGGRIVSGGLTTEDEMCQAFVWYYPKVSFDYCGSQYPREKHFTELGITAHHRSSLNGLPTEYIDAPDYLQGVYDDSMSFKFNWTAEFEAEYRQNHQFGGHAGTCYSRRQENTVNVPNTKYPVGLVEYVPEDKCASKAS